MKRIGKLSNGNLIAEMTPEEWQSLVTQANLMITSLASEVKQYRIRHELSQAQLARKVNLSRNYIAQIERGEASNVSHDVYKRIISAITETIKTA